MPSNWAMEDGDSWDLPNTSRDLDTQEQRQEEEDDRIESRVTTATMPKKNKSKKRRKDLAQACYSFSLLLLISTAVGMLFWSILKQGEYGNSLKPPGSGTFVCQKRVALISTEIGSCGRTLVV